MNRFEERVAGIVAKIEALREEQRSLKQKPRMRVGRGAHVLSRELKEQHEQLNGFLEIYHFYEQKLIIYPNEMRNHGLDSLQTYLNLIGSIEEWKGMIDSLQERKDKADPEYSIEVLDYYIEQYREFLDEELEILDFLPEAADLVRRNYLLSE